MTTTIDELTAPATATSASACIDRSPKTDGVIIGVTWYDAEGETVRHDVVAISDEDWGDPACELEHLDNLLGWESTEHDREWSHVTL